MHSLIVMTPITWFQSRAEILDSPAEIAVDQLADRSLIWHWLYILPKSQRMLSEFQSGGFCWALCSLPWLLQGLSCQPRDTRLRTSVCLVLFPLGFLIICLQEISKTSLPECACIAISLGSSSDSSTTNSFSSESFSGSCNSSHHLHSATGLRGQPAQLHRQGWEMFTQWFGSEYNL